MTAHDPGDSDRQCQRAEVDDGPRQEQAVQAQAEPPRDDRGRDLEAELHHRPHPADVVHDPDHEQKADAGQDRRRAVRPQSGGLAEVRRRERGKPDRHAEGDGHRHAAEARNGDLVDLAPAGHVEQLEPMRRAAHEWCDEQPHDESDGEGEGGQHGCREW